MCPQGDGVRLYGLDWTGLGWSGEEVSGKDMAAIGELWCAYVVEGRKSWMVGSR